MEKKNNLLLNEEFDLTILSSCPGIGVFNAFPDAQRSLKWINSSFLSEYNIDRNIENINKLIIPSQISSVKKKMEKILKDSQNRYEISYLINTNNGIRKIKEVGVINIQNNKKYISGILIDLSVREKISKKIQNETISDIHQDISLIYKNDVNNILAGIDNNMILLKEKMELIGEAYEENPTWRDIKTIEVMLKHLQSTVSFALSFTNKRRKPKPVDVLELVNLSIKTVKKIYNLNIKFETQNNIEKDCYCFLSPERFVEIFILACKTIYEILNLRNVLVTLSLSPEGDTIIINFKLSGIKKNIVFSKDRGLKRFVNYPIESTIVGFIKEIKGNLISSFDKESKEQEIIINIPKYKEDKIIKNILIPQGNSETILLVDDDKAIRKSTSKMLENLGYNVISSRNGFEAEKIFNNNYKKISLVILDIIMPERDGYHTAEAIKKIKKNINLIFMTGYHSTEKKKLNYDIEIIKKPFSLSELANKVKENIQNN